MENNNTKKITDRKGQTLTFYSYKGGVGRSMALVNIACLAAKENKKILLIDCDLEAPGLHQFFKADETTPGFVEFITDINVWLDNPENNTEEGYCRFMAEESGKYIAKNINPVASSATAGLTVSETSTTGIASDKSITVDLMKAGCFKNDYSKKLGAINWLELYKKAPSFFRTFAYCLEKEYDYIFVDARTGLADTSGICTMLMPQKLVLVFALNNQNINGVVDIAAQAIDYRFASHDFRELLVYPLPSRIENSVNPYLQQWIDNYKEKFVKLFSDKYMLDECRLSAYFDRSFIQYYAIHAYGENMPALYETASSSNFITYNYNNFYTVLKKNIPAWEIISMEEEQANEKEADVHYRKGLEFYYKKEWEKSLEHYNKAIQLNPEYYGNYNDRGNIKFELNKPEEAIADYNKAIELKPDFATSYRNRGLVKEKLKKIDEALSDYNKAIELDPGSPEAYTDIGDIKYDQESFSDAINYYDKAIEIDPQNSIIYNKRGNAWLNLTQYEKAHTDYSKAIELSPDFAIAYRNRGKVNRDLKRDEQALVDYTKSIESDPEYVDAYNSRGNLYSDQNKLEEAMADYNKAIELNKDFAIGYRNRGLLKQKMNQMEEALKDFDTALHISPGYVDVYLDRAAIKFGQNNYTDALSEYNKALEYKSDDTLAYYGRGLSNASLLKHDLAISDFNKAIAIDTDFCDAYIGRGYSKIALKQNSEAGIDFDKAVELKPDYIEAYIGRANNKFNAKQYTDACIDFQKAMSLDNKNTDAHVGIGACMYHLKDYKQSLHHNLAAIDLSPSNATPFLNIAYIYRRLDDMVKAKEYVEKATSLNAEDEFCIAFIGEMAGADGDNETFYTNIEKAITLNFDLPREMENEPEYFSKYINEPRFTELLKKYKIILQPALKQL